MANQVQLPETLPGDFFVVEWDRLRDRFVLYVDDPDKSSYDLGNDIQVAMRRFSIWGIPDLGNRVLDLAREFGLAQGAPGTNRALPLFKRVSDQPRAQVQFEEDVNHACLPKLH